MSTTTQNGTTALEPLVIRRLTIENFKRLSAVQITPDGTLVEITGRNAQGKTSVLDAIMAAIGGKRLSPDEPVRKGAKRAEVVVETNLGLIVRRTFTPGGGGSLTVTGKDGAPFGSPQAVLDALFGELSFDPLAFTRMAPKEQAATLQRVAGLDLSEAEAKRKAAYDERTLVNREVARLKAQIPVGPMMVPESEIPDEEEDVSVLAREIDAALHRKDAQRKAANDLESERRLLGHIEHEIAATEARLADLQKQHKTRLDAIESRKRHFEACEFDPEVLGRLEERLRSANETNALVRLKRERRAKRAELEAAVAKSDKLTKGLELIEQYRLQQIEKARLPVPGLSFTDEGVTLNGIPFDQASAAEQLRVSVAMGLALNPRLRVILVRDASLLDRASFALLAQMAEQAGAQVWIETVDRRTPVGVVIEDGHIAPAEAEAN